MLHFGGLFLLFWNFKNVNSLEGAAWAHTISPRAFRAVPVRLLFVLMEAKTKLDASCQRGGLEDGSFFLLDSGSWYQPGGSRSWSGPHLDEGGASGEQERGLILGKKAGGAAEGPEGWLGGELDEPEACIAAASRCGIPFPKLELIGE